ncbi:MAG: nuclear transport factor 2 family protein [Planctomycetes bacterium]|nr:nuclear transport factor 2 family protein [Planctomycetota bacterium]
MKFSAAGCVVFVCLLLGACRSTGGARDGGDELLAICHAQEAAWNARDVDGFMAAGYWNSPDMNFLSGGSWTKGYQPTLERYRANYAASGKEMGKLSFTELDAQTLGADASFVRGKWRLDFEAKPAIWGLFTLVFRRFPEGWRIVSDHTSLGE